MKRQARGKGSPGQPKGSPKIRESAEVPEEQRLSKKPRPDVDASIRQPQASQNEQVTAPVASEKPSSRHCEQDGCSSGIMAHVFALIQHGVLSSTGAPEGSDLLATLRSTAAVQQWMGMLMSQTAGVRRCLLQRHMCTHASTAPRLVPWWATADPWSWCCMPCQPGRPQDPAAGRALAGCRQGRRHAGSHAAVPQPTRRLHRQRRTAAGQPNGDLA